MPHVAVEGGELGQCAGLVVRLIRPLTFAARSSSTPQRGRLGSLWQMYRGRPLACGRPHIGVPHRPQAKMPDSRYR